MVWILDNFKFLMSFSVIFLSLFNCINKNIGEILENGNNTGKVNFVSLKMWDLAVFTEMLSIYGTSSHNKVNTIFRKSAIGDHLESWRLSGVISFIY